MVLDLDFGKRVYDWLGRHERFYKGIRWMVCFSRERKLQRLAIESLGLHDGDHVLDLACGAGVNLPYLTNLVGQTGHVLAVDYSDGMLATASAMVKKHGWHNVALKQGDAARLDFAPQSLDGALCTFALSAMPRETEALHRVASALKPGARFVILDCKAFSGWAKIFNPLIGPLFKYTTNWDYEKDVVARIRNMFGDVRIREFHSGCNYLAVVTKQ